MKLIVITTEHLFNDEAYAINALFENGLEKLHLRKPFSTVSELSGLIRQIDPCFYKHIVLHDQFILADSFGLGGVHINRRNPEVPDFGNFSISRSCHSFEELKEISMCNYVFLSPVFDSVSKQGYKRAYTNVQLLEARKNGIINQSVIALGGITPELLPAVSNYGFGGIAVLGWLWKDYEKTHDLAGLIDRFTNLKLMCDSL